MAVDASSNDTAKYGFDRPEMFSSSLANTVHPYERHVFLCYKTYDSWPSRVEYSDADPLPKLLNSAINDRKLATYFTVCSGCYGVECSDGDVLIFPEMVKYRGLKESDVDSFVDDVLVNGKPWASGAPESLAGAYVFICAHASRDKRCGVCGPILIEKFKEEILARGLNEQVFVSACSHVGGHKYAGNVIIYGTNAEGKVTGDWYGYVTPADVPDLIDVHIGKGEIIEKLWRGQMGVKEEDKAKSEGKKPSEEKKRSTEIETVAKQENTTGCCQGAAGFSCCQNASSDANGEVGDMNEKKTSDEPVRKRSVCLPSWMGKWEQSDILMAAALVGAVATVAVAYSVFRRSA